MLGNYLKIALRNMIRDRQFTLLNLIGLSTGMACAFLIYLWASDELSKDKFHEKDSQLFQVMKNNTDSQGIETDEDTPGILASTLLKEIPEVEKSVSIFPPAEFTFNGILSWEDTRMKAKSKFADKDFFNIFSHPLIQGNKDRVLLDKNAIVISEALALRLFKTPERAIGKTVNWNGERYNGKFHVTGVFKTLPTSASIQFDMLFSYSYLYDKFPSLSDWASSNASTYVILKKNTDIANFNHKISNFIKSKFKASTLTLFVRPYSDRYLYGDYENGILVGGRIAYVHLFSIIGIFILLIACINFINLTTAQASRKLKEIGVKKTIGASRKVLFFQYMTESMLLTFFSLVVAIVLVVLLLPQFNNITGKQLAFHFNENLFFWVLGITFFTGIVAGFYPSTYLSGLKPVIIFKGWTGKSSVREIWARKGLVVFQFMISILLILSVTVIYRQMKFIQSKNLGYNRDNVITFTAEGKIAEAPEVFLSEIESIPGLVKASYMDGDLVGLHSGTTGLDWEGKKPDKIVDFEVLGVGHDLIETLDIKMKDGRSFSRKFGSDSAGIIFNEAAIENMGITNPLGKTVTVWGSKRTIIGVVKNFHFESLYEPMKPFFFLFKPAANNILVKIKAGHMQKTLAQLEKIYRTYNLGIPFEYHFLDENYQKLYAAEQRVSVLSKYFAALAIIISCLGLFGLAAFTAERRIKEIGIRKVLGASVSGIMTMLSRDFIKLVLIGILIASPIAWYTLNNWLGEFAYRIEIGWWVFLLTGALAIVIALITVSFQSMKAALLNPVKSLRSE